GQRFVGGDEAGSLEGKRYLSKALGTLGPSVRAFVPILGSNGEQIGVVSVGLLLEDLEKSSRKLRDALNPAAALSLLIGLVGALALSRDIKKTIFGLEPREIATLLEERNVIISSIKEGIVAVDAENRVILMNDNARRLLAAEDDSAAAATVAGMGLDAIASGGRSVLDQELTLNGKVMLVNRIPLSSRGKSIGAVATFRDMSEVRALAEELTAVRQYTEALRAQHHEFLNKLHVVSGLLQLGRHAEASRYVVSTVARKQESFDLLRRSVETPEIAALVLAKMSEAQELGIEVEIEEGSLFPALRPEATEALVVILGNLLQNAVESLKSLERADKSIVIAFAESPEGFILSVRDNGGGLAPGIRDRLFEKGTTSKDGGRNMGIGLFLVKSRVDELGGRIEALEGDGLEMIVRLDRERIFPSPGGAPTGG
ncbi:MAG: sensor histidine kinase, partial [Spirochaetaceae bacterium]|nr:sensor histidine kinase [Spirochaetaceae bacterium]